MFFGEYKYNIDDKKRLALPIKFRQTLGRKAVLTKGLDNCLFLFSQKDWLVLAKKISKMSFAAADARGFSRIMLAGAMEVIIDGLGRILVPDYLKEYAFLQKKTVIAGLYDRIEIWDEARWQTYKNKTEKEVGDIAERLKELGA